MQQGYAFGRVGLCMYVFMFQCSHTFGITAHAQCVLRKHAEQVAGVCAAFYSAPGWLC